MGLRVITDILRGEKEPVPDFRSILAEVQADTEIWRQANKDLSEQIAKAIGPKLLDLSQEPDEYGSFCGHIEINSQERQLDLLPPLGIWDGHSQLSEHEPHKNNWLIYLDNQEVTCCRTIAQLGIALKQLAS